jgi:hypothetical protein
MNKETIQEVQAKLDEVANLLGPEYSECLKRSYNHKDYLPHLRTLFDKVLQARQIVQVDMLKQPPVARQSFVEEEEQGHIQDFRQKHESFGNISVSRVTGSRRLVGAIADNLPQYIEIRINRADRLIDERLHTEYYFSHGAPLVSVCLSTYQWAELISSLNTTGVPCTIGSVLGVGMEDLPLEAQTPMEQIAKNIKKESRTETQVEAEFNGKLEELRAFAEGLGLTKKKLEGISARIDSLRAQVTAPKEAAAWATRRVTENCEKAISQARIEIAASVTSFIQQAGVKYLDEHIKTLQLPEHQKE